LHIEKRQPNSCLFSSSGSVFFSYKQVEIYFPSIPFLHSYFEDLIAIPIVLKTAQLIIQVIVPNQRNLKLKLFDIALVTVAFAVYFEWHLPFIDPRFTSDWIDVIAYGSGAIFYSVFLNGVIPDHSSEMI
jgi:hypothetical protein